METLENLKNTYAQEQGYDNWNHYFVRHFVASSTSRTSSLAVFEMAMDEICIRAQKAALEKAAEKAEVEFVHVPFDDDRPIVDRTSITNPENIIR